MTSGSTAGAKRGIRSLGTPLLVAFGFLLALVLVEVALQVYSRVVVYPQLDGLLADRRHYMVQSPDPVLGFELAPGYRVESDGKRLAINRHGLREESDETHPGRRKIAILGDSVVMSHGHDQEQTLDFLLEASLGRAGDDAVVLNFGVGGYGFSELLRFLEVKNAIYQADHVLYLLNPNDYTQRDTIYEGADNGTYRLYHRPALKTRWFLGKAIYRYQKRGSAFSSVSWYRWLYEGNTRHGSETLRAMDAYCRGAGCGFSVALFPAGVAYGAGGYALEDMYDEIEASLVEQGIPVLNPVEAFGAEPGRYFDNTDHLTEAGNALMIQQMHRFLREIGAARGG